MTTMTCHDCQKPVSRSDAHLRSVSLELVAICRPCMNVRSQVEALFPVAVAS